MTAPSMQVTPLGAAFALLSGALVVSAASARRWRRISRCFSQVEIDKMVEDSVFELETADLDPGAIAFAGCAVESEDPPTADRRFFWYTAQTCAAHPPDGPRVVHQAQGWAAHPSDAAATMRATALALAPSLDEESGELICEAP